MPSIGDEFDGKQIVMMPSAHLHSSSVYPAVRMRALRGLGQTCYGPSGQISCPSTIPSPYAVGGQCVAPSGSGPGGTTSSQKIGAYAGAASSIGAGILELSPATGPAAPFVALAGALVALATGLGIGHGCGSSCIEATEVVNYAECVMALNLQTYLGMACPRSAAAQAAALQVFNSAWSYIVQSCTAIGGAGGSEQNCIAPRNRGGQYDYFASFYDPINNDTCVSADAAPVNATTGAPAANQDEANSSAVSAVTTATGLSSSSMLPLLLIVGGALLFGGVL